jgi:serine/threonine-protein kinase
MAESGQLAADDTPGVRQAEPDTELKWHRRLTGTRIGRYRLGVRLGIGGAASVYLGRLVGPHRFERLVALKLVHEHLMEQPAFVSMLLDEANLAARLSHPNIVHVYELGRDRDTLFLAMEYLTGQPLARLYSGLGDGGRRLPYDVLAWIGARAAEGLHHAHELCDDSGRRVGLVHRDVSPENLFVTYEGHVKLIDFGIARAVGRLTTTGFGTIKGKYRYMAPEQALGRDFDHRVDLFALGATLYEGALGRAVFLGKDDSDTLLKLLSGPAPDPRSLIPDFPDALATVILRTLAVEPAERYPTAAELAQDLDAFVAASGRVSQRQLLGGLMGELFGAERAAAGRAIAELRGIDGGDGVSQDDPTIAPPRPRRLWRAPLLVVLLLIGLGVFVSSGLARRPAEPALAAVASHGPPVTSVTAEVTAEPPRAPASSPIASVAPMVGESRPAASSRARPGPSASPRTARQPRSSPLVTDYPFR